MRGRWRADVGVSVGMQVLVWMSGSGCGCLCVHTWGGCRYRRGFMRECGSTNMSARAYECACVRIRRLDAAVRLLRARARACHCFAITEVRLMWGGGVVDGLVLE